MGLVPLVCQQILLCGQPTTFEQAVESTEEEEYVLNFQIKPTKLATKDINVTNKLHPMEDLKLDTRVQQALEQMMKRLEALEARLQPASVSQTACDCNNSRNR